MLRFETPVKAGETKAFTVKEEREVSQTITLTNGDVNQLHYVVNLAEASPALKHQLLVALNHKRAWDDAARELRQVVADLQRLTQDQDRIRRNLRETPKEADVYATYLKKLSAQEKEIDALTTKQKKLMDEEFAAQKKYENYLVTIGE